MGRYFKRNEGNKTALKLSLRKAGVTFKQVQKAAGVSRQMVYLVVSGKSKSPRVLAVIENLTGSKAMPGGEPKVLRSLHHTSITVSDIEDCLSLYRELLGMKVIFDMEYGGEKVEEIMAKKGVRFRVVHLRHRDSVLELLQFYAPEKTSGKTMTRHPTDPGYTHIAFLVEDVQALTQTLRSRGYDFFSPPIQTPSGRKVNYFRAHDGVIIELMEDPPGP